MNVAHVLAVKGHTVVTVQPHRTLLEVAGILTEHRIGATVVAGNDSRILGIVSERDIVKAIARHGRAALDDAVSKHMTEKVVTCDEDAMMNDIMDIMTAGKFRHLPVIKTWAAHGHHLDRGRREISYRCDGERAGRDAQLHHHVVRQAMPFRPASSGMPSRP